MTRCHVYVSLCRQPVISLYVKVYTGTLTIKTIYIPVIFRYSTNHVYLH